MAYRKPYAEIPRRLAEKTISSALRFGWEVAHPKTGDPVKEAERALRIRLWLKAVIIFLTTTAVATVFIGFTIDYSCLAVSFLATLITWPVVCIRKSIRASGADEFLDKHDVVWDELTKHQNRDSKPALEKEAVRILNEQGNIIVWLGEKWTEIDIELEAMKIRYDRYREFNLVLPGGVEQFISKPVKKTKLAPNAEQPSVAKPVQEEPVQIKPVQVKPELVTQPA